jgi:hypothetical protein
MAKKRRTSSRPEMLSRDFEISSLRATVRLNAVHRRGEEPYVASQPWLELQGTATEPVREVREVVISMYPVDAPQIGTARPAAVGAIVQARPQLQFVLSWPHTDFDRVWALALAGRLTHGHVYFTKPHYNSGLVVSASFSTELEE